MKPNHINQTTLLVDSLYNSLRKKDAKIKNDYHQFSRLASSYLESGLSESEAIELLVIDGLSREAASSYVDMANDLQDSYCDEEEEYSFVFEDVYGNVFSSNDIQKTVTASSHSEAWEKANELIGDDSEYEILNILSVTKL